jgi:hypothetical protein
LVGDDHKHAEQAPEENGARGKHRCVGLSGSKEATSFTHWP